MLRTVTLPGWSSFSACQTQAVVPRLSPATFTCEAACTVPTVANAAAGGVCKEVGKIREDQEPSDASRNRAGLTTSNTRTLLGTKGIATRSVRRLLGWRPSFLGGGQAIAGLEVSRGLRESSPPQHERSVVFLCGGAQRQCQRLHFTLHCTFDFPGEGRRENPALHRLLDPMCCRVHAFGAVHDAWSKRLREDEAGCGPQMESLPKTACTKTKSFFPETSLRQQALLIVPEMWS